MARSVTMLLLAMVIAVAMEPLHRTPIGGQKWHR